MTTTTHTPTPWPWNIEAVGRDIVATYMNDDQTHTLATATSYANADFLAKRLNAHDGLVAALNVIANAATVGGISAGERKGLARAAAIAAAALAKVAK